MKPRMKDSNQLRVTTKRDCTIPLRVENRQRQTDRQTDREIQRETETERQRETETERQIGLIIIVMKCQMYNVRVIMLKIKCSRP